MVTALRSLIGPLLQVLGLIALVVGIALIYVPAALIIGGGLVIWTVEQRTISMREGDES